MIIAYQLLHHFLTFSEAKKEENDLLNAFQSPEYWKLYSGAGEVFLIDVTELLLLFSWYPGDDVTDSTKALGYMEKAAVHWQRP